MLYNGSDVIRDVEWVIFDEVHYINDSEVRVPSVLEALRQTALVHVIHLCTLFILTGSFYFMLS